MKKIIIIALAAAISVTAPVTAYMQAKAPAAVQPACAALSKTNDSLRTALFNANYKIARVKYYLKICQKHPSQVKFLHGWVIRAVK
jgi:hypothetical protein